MANKYVSFLYSVCHEEIVKNKVWDETHDRVINHIKYIKYIYSYHITFFSSPINSWVGVRGLCYTYKINNSACLMQNRNKLHDHCPMQFKPMKLPIDHHWSCKPSACHIYIPWAI